MAKTVVSVSVVAKVTRTVEPRMLLATSAAN
jgi:hypothetical protein